MSESQINMIHGKLVHDLSGHDGKEGVKGDKGILGKYGDKVNIYWDMEGREWEWWIWHSDAKVWKVVRDINANYIWWIEECIIIQVVTLYTHDVNIYSINV